MAELVVAVISIMVVGAWVTLQILAFVGYGTMSVPPMLDLAAYSILGYHGFTGLGAYKVKMEIEREAARRAAGLPPTEGATTEKWQELCEKLEAVEGAKVFYIFK
jgi:hypothetical protein